MLLFKNAPVYCRQRSCFLSTYFDEHFATLLSLRNTCSLLGRIRRSRYEPGLSTRVSAITFALQSCSASFAEIGKYLSRSLAFDPYHGTIPPNRQPRSILERQSRTSHACFFMTDQAQPARLGVGRQAQQFNRRVQVSRLTPRFGRALFAQTFQKASRAALQIFRIGRAELEKPRERNWPGRLAGTRCADRMSAPGRVTSGTAANLHRHPRKVPFPRRNRTTLRLAAREISDRSQSWLSGFAAGRAFLTASASSGERRRA